MKLKDIFRKLIDTGMSYDIRTKKELERILKEKKKEWDSTKGREKELLDEERTWNPFHDSRILTGTGNEDVKTMFVGIDVDVEQILVADRLREKGKKIDALFLHHPQGRASVEMADDMYLQVEMYRKYGVPVVQAEQEIEGTIEDTRQTSHGDNIFEWQRTAELLKFPGFCCHTPGDNMAYQFLEKGICQQSFENIGELKNALLDIPEFMQYAKNGLPPLLINCDEKSRTGRLAPTGITGGTDGPEVFIAEQATAGVGTILAMHATKEWKDAAKKHHVNIIQLNHYAADDLGVNLLWDIALGGEDLEFFPGCGFYRVERTAKELKFLKDAVKEINSQKTK
jgi:hypothetical protein